jgi:hypothetical protein
VWARDEGATTTVVGRAAETGTVTLAWFLHQGPGDVSFGTPAARVVRSAPTGGAGGGRGGAALPPLSVGSASTTATFSAPGTYIVRVRANDGSVESAGHAQCCWTNGFVKVVVTQ